MHDRSHICCKRICTPTFLQRVAKVAFNLEHYPEASKVMLEQTPMQNEATLSALSSVTSVAGHAGSVEKWP